MHGRLPRLCELLSESKCSIMDNPYFDHHWNQAADLYDSKSNPWDGLATSWIIPTKSIALHGVMKKLVAKKYNKLSILEAWWIAKQRFTTSTSRPASVFQRISGWQVCSHLTQSPRWLWSAWNGRGLHTVSGICWRSVWGWEPAGQSILWGRRVTYCLDLVPSWSLSLEELLDLHTS